MQRSSFSTGPHSLTKWPQTSYNRSSNYDSSPHIAPANVTSSSSIDCSTPDIANYTDLQRVSKPTPSLTWSIPHSTTTEHLPDPDPFRILHDHNLATKTAWTVIPASEGFRILDLCKSLSATHSDFAIPGPIGAQAQGKIQVQVRPPCYNRETIYDEEWQAHMRDVHRVFLLWPETWMGRIEVLDLDAFEGDIGACNEVIMGSN